MRKPLTKTKKTHFFGILGVDVIPASPPPLFGGFWGGVGGGRPGLKGKHIFCLSRQDPRQTELSLMWVIGPNPVNKNVESVVYGLLNINRVRGDFLTMFILWGWGGSWGEIGRAHV